MKRKSQLSVGGHSCQTEKKKTCVFTLNILERIFGCKDDIPLPPVSLLLNDFGVRLTARQQKSLLAGLTARIKIIVQ